MHALHQSHGGSGRAISRLDGALWRLVSISAFLILFSDSARFVFAAESSLAIVGASVQQSEDSPPVPSDYRFLPGDYLYFTFQISGFAIRSEKRGELRRISLEYEATPEDANGVALTPPSSGVIETEITDQDKNWTPKRRTSFLIPSFIAAGEFRVHVRVKDRTANTETSLDTPFRVGGLEVRPTASLTVQNFVFFRGEEDREPLKLPAYSPGDTVYVRFDMTGFKTGAQNQYHLSYGVTVLRPDGKTFIDEAKAAELLSDSFYPAQYVPGVLNLRTSPGAPHGEYLIVLTVQDVLAGSSSQVKKAFSIE